MTAGYLASYLLYTRGKGASHACDGQMHVCTVVLRQHRRRMPRGREPVGCLFKITITVHRILMNILLPDNFVHLYAISFRTYHLIANLSLIHDQFSSKV